MEEYRIIEAERHNIENVMRDFDLPDDSWWNEEEREEFGDGIQDLNFSESLLW